MITVAIARKHGITYSISLLNEDDSLEAKFTFDSKLPSDQEILALLDAIQCIRETKLKPGEVREIRLGSQT